MDSIASLSDLPRTTLNEVVNWGWFELLPELKSDWVYVETILGEHGVDRGRGRMIFQRRRDGALFAIPFYETNDVEDPHEDRFKGEDPEVIRVG